MLSVENILEDILQKYPELNKPFKCFLLEIVLTFLGCKGRFNFRNLSRWSNISERTIRRWFLYTQFSFTSINQDLIDNYVKPEGAILTIDASFIPKSGTKTFGLSTFWDGKNQKATKGLEISTIALVDLKRKQAFTIDTEQSINTDEQTKIDRAVIQLDKIAKWTKNHTQKVVGDGFYAKTKFVNAVIAQKLDLISVLRSDANLKSFYKGVQTKGQKPKVYADKIKWKDADNKHIIPPCFTFVSHCKGVDIYQSICYSVQFKRSIKVVYVHHINSNRHLLLFSTNTTDDALLIFENYTARFQMEYLFRDCKQHLGLTHCQSLKEECLSFHFQLSMMVLNLSKVSVLPTLCSGFSIQNVRSLFFNRRWLDNLFANLDLDPILMKDHPAYPILLNRGIINP